MWTPEHHHTLSHDPRGEIDSSKDWTGGSCEFRFGGLNLDASDDSVTLKRLWWNELEEVACGENSGSIDVGEGVDRETDQPQWGLSV